MRARQTDTDENHALQKCFIQRSADSKPLVISISVVFMSRFFFNIHMLYHPFLQIDR